MKRFYWFVSRHVTDLYYFCRDVIKSIRAGFWVRDCWNLDISFAKWLLPRLKRFRQKTQSHPSDMTYEEWVQVLDEMIYYSECYINNYDLNDRQRELDGQRLTSLFAKHFSHLWD